MKKSYALLLVLVLSLVVACPAIAGEGLPEYPVIPEDILLDWTPEQVVHHMSGGTTDSPFPDGFDMVIIQFGGRSETIHSIRESRKELVGLNKYKEFFSTFSHLRPARHGLEEPIAVLIEDLYAIDFPFVLYALNTEEGVLYTYRMGLVHPPACKTYYGCSAEDLISFFEIELIYADGLREQ